MYKLKEYYLINIQAHNYPSLNVMDINAFLEYILYSILVQMKIQGRIQYWHECQSTDQIFEMFS